MKKPGIFYKLKKLLLPLIATGVIASCEYETHTDLKISGSTEHAEYTVGEEIKLANEEFAGEIESLPQTSEKVDLKNFTGNVELPPPTVEKIELKNRSIIPEEGRLISFNLEHKLKNAEKEKIHVILNYKENLTIAQREHLHDLGIDIHSPIAPKTYIGAVPADIDYIKATSKFDNNELKFAEETLPRDKISPHILNSEFGHWGKKEGMQGFTVQLYDNTKIEAVMQKFENLGAKIGKWENNTISVAVNEKDIDFFVNIAAEDDDVSYISQPSIPLTPNLYNVRRFSKVEALQQSIPTLNGFGVKICIYDGGYVDYDHPDLISRVRDVEEERPSTHATHVACIAAGSGKSSLEALEDMCNRASIWSEFEDVCNMYLNAEDKTVFDKLFKGIAHKATIYSADYGECGEWCIYNTPNDMKEQLIFFTKEGVIIFNMSIGANVSKNGFPCEFNGDYELTSALADLRVYEDGIIIVKSASNERSINRCFMPGDSYGFATMGPLSTAKNLIKVGAVTSDGAGWIKVANYSSAGPTDDGRTGVDVMAVGGDKVTPVISCTPSYRHYLIGLAGTSMSAPAVTGKAALFVEAYREIMGGMDPRPELVKGGLANNAVDIENPNVDFKTGYGLTDAVETNKMLTDGRFFTGKINNTGEDNTLVLYVEDFDNPIKVMLTYTDYPGAPQAAKTQVNDLDLVLISPSGEEYLPFILDPENPNADAVRGVDNRNNIEQVVYGLLPEENVEPGIWKVVVKASDVVYGPVNYAVTTSHPIFDAEPAVIVNKGDEISGYLKAEIRHEECPLPEECYDVIDKTLLDDRQQGITTTFEPESKLELWRVVPPYVSYNPGSSWFDITFVDDDGKTIENSDGSLVRHKAYFSVKE